MNEKKFKMTAMILGFGAVLAVLLIFGIVACGASSSKELSEMKLSEAKPVSSESLQSDSTAADVSTFAVSKMDAINLVQRKVVEPMIAKADLEKGLKVLQYQEALPSGARIEPAFTSPGIKPEAIVTENPSWLFMIDEAPGAHFSHPVKLVVVDSKTETEQVIEAEWWPKVNNKQVFDTVSIRSDPSVITYYKEPKYSISPAFKKVDLDLKNIFTRVDSCSNWAVIVCGFNDPSDTFHIDTNGIYSVLKSFGIDDSHIFYTSPQGSDPGVDRPTTVANVQWAISQVAGKSKNTDKVLFFYSSHGGINLLSCAPDVDPVGHITAGDLAGWLNAITCKEMSIIVEACHSGSLIGKYRDGTYRASEDELTGAGISNRVVFTSASTDTSSYPDVEGPDDPNAASDLGSESIYGFMMAYSVPSADTNHDGKISFGEAYQYAWNTDVTRIRGDNVPQLREAGLNKNNVYLQCLKSGSSVLKPDLTAVVDIHKKPPIGPGDPEVIRVATMKDLDKAVT